MKNLRILNSFVFILLISCASRPHFSENKNLYGKIYDSENHPVSNARIILNNASITESDSEGNFVFYTVKKNKNNISVTSPLFQPFSETFKMGSENQFVQIRLKEMNAYVDAAKKAVLEKDYEKAKLILEEAVKINSHFQPAYVFLALLYQKEGKINSINDLDQAIEEKVSRDALEMYLSSLGKLYKAKKVGIQLE